LRCDRATVFDSESVGGQARLTKMTPAERSAVAKKGGKKGGK